MFVKGREHVPVVAILLRPSEHLDPLYQDLAIDQGLAFEKAHHFSDVVGKRHGRRIVGLIRSRELGLYVRRDQFENINTGSLELNPQLLDPGMEECLAGTVGRKVSAGHERQSGRRRDYGRVRSAS
jgi:hypothetical protein